MKSTEIIHHASVYAIGNVLIQCLSFALLPICTRCLSPDEFGRLEILNRIAEFVVICFLFNGLRQTVILRCSSDLDQSQRQRVAQAAVLGAFGFGVLATAAVFVVLVCCDVPVLSSNQTLVLMAVFVSLCDAAVLVLLGLAQARFESRLYLLTMLSLLVHKLALTIVLVVFLGLGIWGLLAASLCSSVLHLLFVAYREWPFGHGANPGPTLAVLLRESVCFLPGGIAFFLLNYGDRFLLLRWADEHEIGLYALSCKLAMAVLLLCRSPIAMVWGPLIQRVARQPDAEKVFGSVVTRAAGIYIVLAVGVCILGRDAILFLAGEPYADAAKYLVPMVLAYFFLAVADTLESVFYAHQRTYLKAISAPVAAVTIVMLYLILIPAHGAFGAALATMLGYLVHVVITLLLSRRLMRVRVEWRRLGLALCLAAGALSLAETFEQDTLWIVLRFMLWILWVMLLWRLGLVSAAERAAIRRFLRMFAMRTKRWLRHATLLGRVAIAARSFNQS